MKRFHFEIALNDRTLITFFKKITIPNLTFTLIAPRIRYKRIKNDGSGKIKHIILDVPMVIEYYSNECLFSFKFAFIFGIEVYYQWDY